MDDDEVGYYTILGIEKTNDRGTIWKGFRAVGTKYLYDEDSDHKCTNSIMFAKIWEAYEVLSNPDLKQIYDNYGEMILKNGLPTGSGHPGYAFTGDWYESFISALKKPVMGETEEKKSASKKKVPDLVVELHWTLRELYNGWIKTITYKKEKLLHYSGRKTENINCEKDIEIRPGYAHNQEIRFDREGHDAVGVHSGDLVVKIIQIPHESYYRVDNHLIYKKSITMAQSLMPESFQIITLDDRILNVSVSEVITQETATVIPGEGMPVCNKNDHLLTLKKRQKHGDLIVKYEIEFPAFLSESQKKKMKSALGE